MAATGVSSRGLSTGVATPSTVAWPTGWWALGIGRIIIGYLWFQQTLWKLPSDFGSPGGCPTSLSAKHLGGLCDWMHREAAHAFVPLYGSFVKDVAIPNFGLFGSLTWLTETALAISLVLGLLGRLGGLVATLWAINLTIGLWAVPGEWYWTYVMLALLNAVFFATAANRYIGVDMFLRRYALSGPRTPIKRLIALAS